MKFIPKRGDWRSLSLFLLTPAVIWPLAGALFAVISKATPLPFLVLEAYVMPPFFLAEALGIKNTGAAPECYDSPLFEGFIGIFPTFPLGWIYCVLFWFLAGYIVWICAHALKTKIQTLCQWIKW